MAKEPYLKFYMGDYIKDTRILPLNVRGAWADLILFMWDNDPKGEISGTMDDFSRLMCCSVEEANLVIQTLKQRKIFDYHESIDGSIKIVSRKQKEMIKLSETRSKSGKNGGNPKLAKPKEEILLNQKDNLNPEYEYNTDELLETGEEKGGMGEREGVWKTMPGEENLGLELPEIKAGSAMQLMHYAGNKSTIEQVYGLWDVFKVQNFTGKKFYQTPNDTFSHFINWSKTQKVNGTDRGHGGNGSSKPGTSEARIRAAKGW